MSDVPDIIFFETVSCIAAPTMPSIEVNQNCAGLHSQHIERENGFQGSETPLNVCVCNFILDLELSNVSHSTGQDVVEFPHGLNGNG